MLCNENRYFIWNQVFLPSQPQNYDLVFCFSTIVALFHVSCMSVQISEYLSSLTSWPPQLSCAHAWPWPHCPCCETQRRQMSWQAMLRLQALAVFWQDSCPCSQKGNPLVLWWWNTSYAVWSADCCWDCCCLPTNRWQSQSPAVRPPLQQSGPPACANAY